MFCANCGKELDNDNKFCPYCGYENRNYHNIIDNDAIGIKHNDLPDENSFNVKENTKYIKNDTSSYFRKHWEGKLSLGISYWVNNVLFSILLGILIVLLAENIDFTNNHVLPSIAVISLWIFIFIFTLWVLIGLWRSANNHIKKYNKYFWANVAKFLVIIGGIQFVVLFISAGFPQIVEFTKIALDKDDISDYKISILNNGKELEISGGIRFGLTNDVKKYFIEYPNINIIHLNSIGGRITEAQKLSKFLKNKKIITYSSIGCYSACVDIFMSGEYRFINTNADLGFHEPIFPGMTKDVLREATYSQKQYYLQQGVKKDFVEKAFTTPNNDMWKPSHFELIQARVIDKVVDGTEFAVTDLYLWKDAKKIESSLLKIPAYQTIKIYEPNEFNIIVQIIHSSVMNGDTRIEMYSKIRKIVQKLYLKYLPRSSDKILLDSTQLMLDEMKTLYEFDPILAYNYAMGIQDGFDPNKYFSKELLLRELNSINDVIKTGATFPQQIPSVKSIENIQSKLYLELYKKIGKDLFILDKLESNDVDKTKASQIIIKYYEEILKLPNNESVQMLRFIFQGM